MASNEKEQPEKIHCLFHRKTDCICIAPVTDDQTLKMRLEHAIKLNELSNKFENNMDELRRREAQTSDFRASLEKLVNAENPFLIPAAEIIREKNLKFPINRFSL